MTESSPQLASLAASEAELVIEFEGWTRRVPLAGGPLVLGRSEDCDLALADPRLSRRHCRLSLNEGVWWVEDLGSTGGTYVDGRPVGDPVVLPPEVSLRLGAVRVHLEVVPARSVLSGHRARDARNVELLLGALDDLYAVDAIEGLLRNLVDRAVHLAAADRGALLLERAGGGLEVAVARGADGRDLSAEQVLTRSLPARALEMGRAVVLADAQQPDADDGSIPTSVADGALRSVLCVPLPDRDGLRGVLYVDSRRPVHAFGPAELAVFEALAMHGALAIERARLREQQARRDEQQRRRLEDENAALKLGRDAEAPIGQSASMQTALELVRRIAPSDATVLLLGQTGTGKEVLARRLHRLSGRSRGPFVVVDCGAIPEGLIESELFGHEKGAFSGATASREGRFREAEGGTVLLDEIAELPLLLQTRLLRVLQDRTVQPVGGSARVPVDARIVCATHRDLEQLVTEGRFRQDLYYRISAFRVQVPGLRERGEDVLLLAQHFLSRFAALYGTAVAGFTQEARAALLAQAWTGNVRELENRVQRAALLARPPLAGAADLGLEPGKADRTADEPGSELPFPQLQQARAEATERFERVYLEEALRRAGGRLVEAAAAAGISRQMFWRLLRRHAIDRRPFREGSS